MYHREPSSEDKLIHVPVTEIVPVLKKKDLLLDSPYKKYKYGDH